MIDLGNVLIFGDSYSTFQGYIPKENAYYYGLGHYATDVTLVDETWWHQLLSETNSNLILNDSWSGSTLCHTGYENSDTSNYSSFVFRLNRHISNGFFDKNKIDTVFIFGGTNDSWANSPIGELKYADWDNNELFSFCPAICYMISKLKEVLQNARIVCIINSDLKLEITDGTIAACDHYGAEYVKLCEIDKMGGHPSVKGMQQIKDLILQHLMCN